MNGIFICIMCISLGLMILHTPNNAFDTLITGSTKAINLGLKLLAIYAVWLSLIELVNRTNLHKLIAKFISPITRRLFCNLGKAEYDVAINIVTNVFGMGNACTPSGIKAMQLLDRGNIKINYNMAMLFVLNVTSLELIPSTVIGLRTSMGSSNPTNIILPTLIATASSTLCGIILIKLFGKKLHKD